MPASLNHWTEIMAWSVADLSQAVVAMQTSDVEIAAPSLPRDWGNQEVHWKMCTDLATLRATMLAPFHECSSWAEREFLAWVLSGDRDLPRFVESSCYLGRSGRRFDGGNGERLTTLVYLDAVIRPRPQLCDAILCRRLTGLGWIVADDNPTRLINTRHRILYQREYRSVMDRRLGAFYMDEGCFLRHIPHYGAQSETLRRNLEITFVVRRDEVMRLYGTKPLLPGAEIESTTRRIVLENP